MSGRRGNDTYSKLVWVEQGRLSANSSVFIMTASPVAYVIFWHEPPGTEVTLILETKVRTYREIWIGTDRVVDPTSEIIGY